MSIPDSDPRAAELDQQFAAAFSGPAKPTAEAKTPADIDPEAPFGRAEDNTPIAPYGTTKEGRIRRSAGGRPAKGSPDHARTATPGDVAAAAQEAGPRSPKPEARNWSPELDELGDAVWFGLSAAATVAPNIPVIGKKIPADKLAAEAFILNETKPRIVAAVNLAAQHSARAATFCQGLEGGDGLWALTCMFLLMPVVSIGVTVWKADPDELKEAELPTLAEMAAKNGLKMDAMIARINAQITEATQAATAIVVCQNTSHDLYGLQGCTECAAPAAAAA